MARADREAKRAARRAAKAARQETRLAAKGERQTSRQGFLSGIVGEEGLSGLINTAADSGLFGGGDVPQTKESEGKDDLMSNPLLLVGIGLAAYMLMKK